MHVHVLRVLEDKRDRVGDQQRERAQPDPHARLEALAELLAVDVGAAQAHAETLDRGVRADQAARDEPRLGGRLERAGLVHPEGGAGVVAGKRAETGAAEKAVIASYTVLLAHSQICPTPSPVAVR